MTITIYCDAGFCILLYFTCCCLVISSYILNSGEIVALLFHVLEVNADINPKEIVGLLFYPNSIFKKKLPSSSK